MLVVVCCLWGGGGFWVCVNHMLGLLECWLASDVHVLCNGLCWGVVGGVGLFCSCCFT